MSNDFQKVLDTYLSPQKPKAQPKPKFTVSKLEREVIDALSKASQKAEADRAELSRSKTGRKIASTTPMSWRSLHDGALKAPGDLGNPTLEREMYNYDMSVFGVHTLGDPARVPKGMEGKWKARVEYRRKMLKALPERTSAQGKMNAQAKGPYTQADLAEATRGMTDPAISRAIIGTSPAFQAWAAMTGGKTDNLKSMTDYALATSPTIGTDSDVDLALRAASVPFNDPIGYGRAATGDARTIAELPGWAQVAETIGNVIPQLAASYALGGTAAAPNLTKIGQIIANSALFDIPAYATMAKDMGGIDKAAMAMAQSIGKTFDPSATPAERTQGGIVLAGLGLGGIGTVGRLKLPKVPKEVTPPPKVMRVTPLGEQGPRVATGEMGVMRERSKYRDQAMIDLSPEPKPKAARKPKAEERAKGGGYTPTGGTPEERVEWGSLLHKLHASRYARGRKLTKTEMARLRELTPKFQGSFAMNEWREAVDAQPDPFMKKDVLEIVANAGRRVTDADLVDVLNRLDEAAMGSGAWNVAHAVSVHPSASDPTKARAVAMREEWMRPGRWDSDLQPKPQRPSQGMGTAKPQSTPAKFEPKADPNYQAGDVPDIRKGLKPDPYLEAISAPTRVSSASKDAPVGFGKGQRRPVTSQEMREHAQNLKDRAQALRDSSWKRWGDVPGTAVTGASGWKKNFGKKADKAAAAWESANIEADKLVQAAQKWDARANRIDPEVIRKNADSNNAHQEARSRVKAAESAKRKAAPIINNPSAMPIASAEWASTHRDYKLISVRDGVRVRYVMRDNELHEVYLTDKPAVTKSELANPQPKPLPSPDLAPKPQPKPADGTQPAKVVPEAAANRIAPENVGPKYYESLSDIDLVRKFNLNKNDPDVNREITKRSEGIKGGTTVWVSRANKELDAANANAKLTPKPTLAEMGRKARADKSLDETLIRNDEGKTLTLREHADDLLSRGYKPEMVEQPKYTSKAWEARLDKLKEEKQRIFRREFNASAEEFHRGKKRVAEIDAEINGRMPRELVPRAVSADGSRIVLTKAQYDYMTENVEPVPQPTSRPSQGTGTAKPTTEAPRLVANRVAPGEGQPRTKSQIASELKQAAKDLVEADLKDFEEGRTNLGGGMRLSDRQKAALTRIAKLSIELGHKTVEDAVAWAKRSLGDAWTEAQEKVLRANWKKYVDEERKSQRATDIGAPNTQRATDIGDRVTSLDMSVDEIDSALVRVGELSDGRLVRSDVPNMNSIGASLDDYVILNGVRSIPMNEFADARSGRSVVFNSKSESVRTNALAKSIGDSNEINPLIIVYDNHPDGPYVLEGGHRYDALRILGAKEIPAVVVIDTSEVPNTQRATDIGTPNTQRAQREAAEAPTNKDATGGGAPPAKEEIAPPSNPQKAPAGVEAQTNQAFADNLRDKLGMAPISKQGKRLADIVESPRAQEIAADPVAFSAKWQSEPPRPLRDEEVAGLAGGLSRLIDDLDTMQSRHSKLIEEGNLDAAAMLDMDMDNLRDKIATVTMVVHRTGTQWGLGGIARRLAIQNDYSAGGLTYRLTRGTKRKATPTEVKKAESHAKSIADAEAEIDRRVQEAIERRLREMGSAQPRAGRTPKQRIFTEDAYQAAVKRLRAGGVKQSKTRGAAVKISAQDFQDLAVVLGYHIENGVRSLADLRKTASEVFPDADANDVALAAKAAIDEAKAKRKPPTTKEQTLYTLKKEIADVTDPTTLQAAKNLMAEIDAEQGKHDVAFWQARYKKASDQLRVLNRGKGLGEDILLRGTDAIQDPEVRQARIALERRKADAEKWINALEREAKTGWQKVADAALNILDIPRTLKASLDLSAPGRQGALLIMANPIRARKAFSAQMQAISKRGAENVLDGIQTHKHYDLGMGSKLAIMDVTDSGLFPREEHFVNDWTNKIPGVSHSNRAYSAFLSQLRMDWFSSMIDTLEKNGAPVTRKEAAQIAHFVNVATGRGTLGNLEKAGPTLAKLLFAPKWAMSRIQYAAGQPIWRAGGLKTRTGRLIAAKYAQTLGGYAITATVLSLLGMKIGSDPNESDFGKAILGDWRYDITGNMGQWLTLGSRTVTGQMDVYRAYAFLRSKLAPIPGLTMDFYANNQKHWYRRDANGDKEPITPPSALWELGMPIGASKVAEQVQKGEPVSEVMKGVVPEFFGIGAAKYRVEQPPRSKSKTSSRPSRPSLPKQPVPPKMPSAPF